MATSATRRDAARPGLATLNLTSGSGNLRRPEFWQTVPTIRNQMAKGAAWMLLARLAERGLGLMSTLVLARVLAPADFGIVAMAMSFVALLELMTAFGFETSLVQKQSDSRDQLDTAWTYSILFGVLVALGMVAGAGSISKFFGEVALEDALRVLALGFLIQSFQNIGVVAFRIQMRFDLEFRFLVAKKLAAVAVTVPLAILLESYWALVIGQVVSRAVGTALSYLVHPYRPRVSLAASRDLFRFSKWVLALNWAGYLLERSPDWILGRQLGAGSVGVFTVASELARLPSTEISAPINRAVFSGYARLQDDAAALRREYLAVLGMVCLVAFPAALGLAATAELFVTLMLGSKWLAAIPVIKVMALYGLMSVLQSNTTALYFAIGRADIAAKVAAFNVVLLVVAMIPLAAAYGIIGAAAAYVLSVGCVLPISLLVIVRTLGLTARDIAHAVARPVSAGATMFLVVSALGKTMGSPATVGAAGLYLLAMVVAGCMAYVTVVCVLWRLSGRPDCAELMLLRRAYPAAARRLEATS
jgi:lipopolysaccharide exporter